MTLRQPGSPRELTGRRRIDMPGAIQTNDGQLSVFCIWFEYVDGTACQQVSVGAAGRSRICRRFCSGVFKEK